MPPLIFGVICFQIGFSDGIAVVPRKFWVILSILWIAALMFLLVDIHFTKGGDAFDYCIPFGNGDLCASGGLTGCTLNIIIILSRVFMIKFFDQQESLFVKIPVNFLHEHVSRESKEKAE